MTLRPSLEGVTVSGHACIAVAEGTRGEPLLAILNREGERTKRKQKLLCNDAKLARKTASAHEWYTKGYVNLPSCAGCTKIDLN